MNAVATLNTKSSRTMHPHVMQTVRLDQTVAMLMPKADSASVRSLSSIGTPRKLIAKANEANSAPTTLPTKSNAQPSSVDTSIGRMLPEVGNGNRPKNSA